jgi:hypothetical protein
MSPLVTYVLIGLVAVVAGRFLYKKDTEKEDRRRAAIRMSGVYRTAGLTHTAEFLEAYAVGDYSRMAKKLKQAAALLDSADAGEKALQDMLARIRDAAAPAAD